jgi:hypothetical protein
VQGVKTRGDLEAVEGLELAIAAGEEVDSDEEEV